MNLFCSKDTIGLLASKKECRRRSTVNAKFCLKNNIADWKEKWLDIVENEKPIYISDCVWTGLKAYWAAPCTIRMAALGSVAQMMPDPEENLPIVHNLDIFHMLEWPYRL